MTDNAEPAVHPVQTPGYGRGGAQVRTEVTLRAYEVYCHVHGEQAAIVTGGCRGGFHVGELVAYLYAYPFPKNEWSQRVKEAFHGMKGL